MTYLNYPTIFLQSVSTHNFVQTLQKGMKEISGKYMNPLSQYRRYWGTLVLSFVFIGCKQLSLVK